MCVCIGNLNKENKGVNEIHMNVLLTKRKIIKGFLFLRLQADHSKVSDTLLIFVCDKAVYSTVNFGLMNLI